MKSSFLRWTVAAIAAFTTVPLARGAVGTIRTESVSPLDARGASQVFTIVLSSTAGYQDIPQGDLVLSPSTPPTTSCLVTYKPGGGLILAGDIPDVSPSTVVPAGGNGYAANSQCIVHGSGTSVTGAGNRLTITLSITFKANVSGQALTLFSNFDSASSFQYQPLTTYTVSPLPDFRLQVSPSRQTVQDADAVFTVTVTPLNGFTGEVALTAFRGLQLYSASFSISPPVIRGQGTATLTISSKSSDTGTFTVSGSTSGPEGVTREAFGGVTISLSPQPGPAPVVRTESVTPTNGSGASRLFTFVFSGSTGFQNIPRSLILFNETVTGQNACWVSFAPSGEMYLSPDDPRLNWQTVPRGTDASVENSQCRIDGRGTSVSGSGNTLTVTLAITFHVNFSGKTLKVYSNADSASSFNYQTLTTYTVPPLPDFRIEISPATQAVRDRSATYTVTVTPLNGFSADVTLTASSFLNSVTLSLQPAVLRGGGTATLTVSATASRSGTITVTGSTSGTGPLTRSATAQMDIQISPPPLPVVKTQSFGPANGSGSGGLFTFVFSSSHGYGNIPQGHILINETLTGVNACWFTFSPVSAGIHLAPDDPAEGWQLLTFGSNQTVRNSQCAVNGVGTYRDNLSDSLFLQVSITFRANFSNKTLTIYSNLDSASSFAYQPLTTYRVDPLPDFSLSISPATQPISGTQASFTVSVNALNGFAQSVTLSGGGPGPTYFNPATVTAGGTSTLTVLGNPTTNGTILVTGVADGIRRSATARVTTPLLELNTAFSPANGAGTAQVFSFRFTDSSGYNGIANGNVLFAPAFDGRNSCWLFYDRAANTVWLARDDISIWDPLPLGLIANGTLQNSQCSIGAAGAGISQSGTDLVLNLPVTFKPAFAGQKNVYMVVRDRNGGSSDYRAVGTWTVR